MVRIPILAYAKTPNALAHSKLLGMKRIGFLLALALVACAPARDVTLTILHVNDTHGRIEPTRLKGQLYGGFARLGTLVERYRKSDPNPIFIHAGDVFQGTLYFTQYTGLADLAMLNAMGLDAMALGNHEFDKGVPALADFVSRATFPILAANLDFDLEPRLHKVAPSTILTRGGEKFGIVGAITEDLPTIANPGPTVRMKPLVSSIQAAIDALQKQGVNKIILLSHVGNEVDRAIAQQLRGVDVIIGGHSHTLLSNQPIPNFPAPVGPYPMEAKDKDGKRVLIAQAWEWAKVMGRLQVRFNRAGDVIGVVKAEPIVVTNDIPEQPVLKAMADAFAKPIEAFKTQKVAVTTRGLPRDVDGGKLDTPMANVITDAMVAATESQNVVGAFMNAGGVRAGLEAGDITFADAISVQPFGNTLVVMDLTGDEVKRALEHGLSGGGGFLHVSASIEVKADTRRPAGDRVVAVKINGTAVDPKATYRLVVNSFIAGGGDNHQVLKDAKGRRYDTGTIDLDALVEYLKKNTPVERKSEGRVTDAAK